VSLVVLLALVMCVVIPGIKTQQSGTNGAADRVRLSN
jgi:hypothetical protein